MRIRVPRGLTKDQIFIVVALGLGTGIYSWNGLLKDHMKEREKELMLNEVINLLTKSKNLLANQGFRWGFIGFSIAVSIIGFKFGIQPWFKMQKAHRAEQHANFVYEQRMKRASEQQSKD